MMGEMPKEIPRGVVSLEFFDDEVSVGFFHKRKESFRNLKADDKLRDYMAKYNNNFFHRRPEPNSEIVNWYDRNLSSVPREIEPSLETIAKLVNLI